MKANVTQIYDDYECSYKDTTPLDVVLSEMGIEKYEDAALGYAKEFLDLAEDYAGRGKASSAMDLMVDARVIIEHLIEAKGINND